LTIFNELGDTQVAANAMLGLAKAERTLGSFEDSLRDVTQALQAVEEVRSRIRTDSLRASFLGSWRNSYEFYIDLVLHFPRSLAPEGNTAFAFLIAEMARARSLLDTLNRADAARQEDEQEKNLRRELASQGNRLLELRLRGKTEEAAQVDLSIGSLEEKYDQLESTKILEGHSADPLQPRFLAAEDVRQKLVDEQTIFLEYFLGAKRSYLWAITSGEVSVFELPAQSAIEESTRKFLDSLRNRGASSGNGRAAELHRRSRDLTALLPSPVADRLRNRRLIVVADGPLQYLPFAALERPQFGLSSSTAYTPLVLSNEVVSLPSASAFAAQQEALANRTPAPRTLAVLADPVFSQQDPRVQAVQHDHNSSTPPIQQASLSASVERMLEHVQPGALPGTIPRLPFTAIEADKIFAMAPAATSKKAVGFNAARNLALSPELGAYRYLHFATHGYMDARHPELSALVLSLVDKDGNEKDGFLRLQDIYNLHLRADLVVLSACETGLGREIRGEGLIGLTRGFMYAGAARVVVSLWNVSDQGTSELMPRFYRNMFERHMAPAAALRRAQIAMLASRQWQDPYYWAPFTLQGEWK
jgi:CHAT domain-containing protein